MSQPVPVWLGSVDPEGVLRLSTDALFRRYVRTLANKPVQLVVKRATRSKSRSQLGYLFGVVYPVLADELGYRDYEIEAVHDAVMRELRGLKPGPNPLQLRVSLSAMSHEDVSEYIEDVRHWAVTMFGCVTPDAEKVEVKRGSHANREHHAGTSGAAVRPNLNA